jgi:hypothetical protein
VLVRVKTLARGGLTSMMVLGDFLRRRIAPLQQRSRMAYMFTGVNDCCKVVRGVGTDLSNTELETSIRVMTGEAHTPESLVLPRGIKALCEDQAMRTAVLASMPTLDEGGLAVRQVGGDPNRGIRIPGTSPDSEQRADQGPGASCHGGPAPAGRGRIRSLSRSGRVVRSAPSRPARMTRYGEWPPPGAARSTRRPGPKGSAAATDPS